MKQKNPSIIMSYNVKRLLILILSLQISIWAVYGMDLLGFQIHLLRQLLTFVYLSFVPGVLILRILKLENINNIEALIYSIGISLAILMNVGFAMNYLYPLVGISQPLSFLPILITMSILIIILSTVTYIRNQSSYENYSININNYISLNSLFLIIIPFLTILGVYTVDIYGNNFLIFFALILILAAFLLIAFDKIPQKFYPLTIFIVSISLLYHISLISNFIYGRDAFYEYFVSSMTLKNLYWNPYLAYEVNSLLSITILPTIYQEFCNVSLAYIFKVFYPFFFALVPLTLYELFRKQISPKMAFLACFFLVSIISFYAEMPQLLRQEIAELFFALSLLLLMNYKLNQTKKAFLLLLFLFAITFSHYAMSYFYIFFVFSIFAFQKIVLTRKFRRLNKILKIKKLPMSSKIPINFSFVALAIVLVFAWFIFVSNSITFNLIVKIGDIIFKNISYDFFNINNSEALNIAATKSQEFISLKMVTYLNLLATFFISLGLFFTIFKDKRREFGKFIPEYLVLSIINFLFWICAVVIPYFSSILTANRLYHITLLILSPFVVIGGIKFFNLLRIEKEKAIKLVAICIACFFVFNVGIVGSLIGEKTSMALSGSSADFPKSNELEITSAKWLASYKDVKLQTFADIYRRPIVGAFDWDKSDIFSKDLSKARTGYTYVYLGTLNIETGEALIDGGRFTGGHYIIIWGLIQNKQRIYDNGKSVIYH